MYSTLQAAKQIGIAKNTLLRWISLGLIEEVDRDWRGWRVWSEEDIHRAKAFQKRYHSQPIPRVGRRPVPKAEHARQAAQSMAKYGRALRRAPGGTL